MLKGIRAQLFFGFGALVVVINLFYFRMTSLFVEVTESWVSNYILEREKERFNDQTIAPASPADFLSNDIVLLSEATLTSMGELNRSLFDSALFQFEFQGVRGFAYVISTDRYIALNTQNTLALANFSSVFGVFLFSAAVGVILLTILSTWFVASKLSAPIISLTEKVASQEVQSPCDIDESSRQDEIGKLARTFEQTYRALQQAWRREHDFASDVSHELRTPIALIQNTLVLNQDEKGNQTPMSDDDKQLLVMSAHTLQNTVEVLLALARKENLVFESQPLLPFIERTLLSLYGANPDNQFEVDVEVSAKISGVGNGHLITLLFQNLINNGFYHGGKSAANVAMRIYSITPKVSMSDRVDETEQDTLEHFSQAIVFENAIDNSPSSNYQGLGHGQYLVHRIAQVMAWRVDIKSTATTYAVTVYPKC